MPTEASDWVAVLAGCGIIFLIWHATRTRWPIKITIDQSGVKSHKGLPKAKAGQIVRCFNEGFEFKGKLVVLAIRHSNGHLETRFVGTIDPGTKQRMRNVLILDL